MIRSQTSPRRLLALAALALGVLGAAALTGPAASASPASSTTRRRYRTACGSNSRGGGTPVG
jgi:hypothetical protein